jgi:hypothetical protein
LHLHIAFLLSLFFLQVIQNDYGYDNGPSSTKKKGKKGKRANGKQEKKRV